MIFPTHGDDHNNNIIAAPLLIVNAVYVVQFMCLFLQRLRELPNKMGNMLPVATYIYP